MRVITIGFSRPKNHRFPIFSWAIRAFEKTPYSHVYLSWRSVAGPEVVYEAGGSRVRFMNRKIFDKIAHTTHSFTFLIDAAAYKKLMRFVMTNVGIRYGVRQILGIALSRIMGWKNNPFADGKKSQVCSETVAYFLRDVLGYDINFNPETAGPREIFEYLVKISNERVTP